MSAYLGMFQCQDLNYTQVVTRVMPKNQQPGAHDNQPHGSFTLKCRRTKTGLARRRIPKLAPVMV
jgi:hypothetical protein